MRSGRSIPAGDRMGSDAGGLAIVDLPADRRLEAVPIVKDGFVGVYRWHAKRTLLRIERVRAAVRSGELLGIAMRERLTPEVGYVYYVAVGSAARRSGVGGALLDDAVDGFRREGARIVYAAVQSDNTPSQRLFRSRGFRPIARDEPSYREGGLGAQGLRSRMWVVRGEELLGRWVDPAPGGGVAESPTATAGARRAVK